VISELEYFTFAFKKFFVLPKVSVVDREEGVEGSFAEVGGVVESSVLVEAIDGGHILSAQLEIEEAAVLDKTLLFDGLGDDYCAALVAPLEDDLASGPVVLGGEVCDGLGSEDEIFWFGHAKFHIGSCTKVAECHHHNSSTLRIP